MWVFLLCAAFAVSVTTADPVTEVKPEPVEDPAPVQQNKTAEGRRGELLRRIAGGKMSTWQEWDVTKPPEYLGMGYCPYDWQRYGPRCFFFIDMPMAWIDAEKHCQQYGANLASIHDEQEVNFIWDIVSSSTYGPVWIGGHDAVRTGDWLWSDGSGFDMWTKVKSSSWDRWKKCLTVDPSDFYFLDHFFCEKMLPFICGTRSDLLM